MRRRIAGLSIVNTRVIVEGSSSGTAAATETNYVEQATTEFKHSSL